MRIVFLTNTYSQTAVSYIRKLADANEEIVGVFLVAQRTKYQKKVLKLFSVIKQYGLSAVLGRLRKTLYLHLRYLMFGKLKRINNRKKKEYLSIEELSLDYSLPLVKVRNINHDKTKDGINSLKPDIIFVCTLNQIVQKEILDIPRHGCINIHAGLLPRYRGPASNFWVLFNGEEKTGITFHYMTEGVDDGDIILQKELRILPDDTEDMLDIRLAKLGSESICEVIKQIGNGTFKRRPQSEQQASYFRQPNSRQRKKLTKIRKNITSNSMRRVCDK